MSTEAVNLLRGEPEALARAPVATLRAYVLNHVRAEPTGTTPAIRASQALADFPVALLATEPAASEVNRVGAIEGRPGFPGAPPSAGGV